jgi:hypothetical protein
MWIFAGALSVRAVSLHARILKGTWRLSAATVRSILKIIEELTAG